MIKCTMDTVCVFDKISIKSILNFTFIVLQWQCFGIGRKNDNESDNNNKIKIHFRAQDSKIGELKITVG